MSLSIILVATTHYSQVSASKCLSSRLTSPSLRIFHECTVHGINVRGFFPIALLSVFGKRRFLDLWHILHQICQWTLKDDLETQWDSSKYLLGRYFWPPNRIRQFTYVGIQWRYLDLHETGKFPALFCDQNMSSFYETQRNRHVDCQHSDQVALRRVSSATKETPLDGTEVGFSDIIAGWPTYQGWFFSLVPFLLITRILNYR